MDWVPSEHGEDGGGRGRGDGWEEGGRETRRDERKTHSELSLYSPAVCEGRLSRRKMVSL